MAKLDLDQSYSVNGVRYEKGEGVDVDSKHVQAIKDMQEAGAAQRAWETTHHGAVPQPSDPQEATAQTPTRPLGAPNLVQEQKLVPNVESGEVIEVKDPGNVGADESNKDVVSKVSGSVEANKQSK